MNQTKMRWLVLLLSAVPAMAHAEARRAEIDYSKKYDCKVSMSQVTLRQGSIFENTPVKTESAKLGFEVESDYVFVTSIEEDEDLQTGKKVSFATRLHVLPNHHACDKLFANKQMVIDRHATATGFQSARCEKDQLTAEYFLSTPYGGYAMSVEMESAGDGLTLNVRSVRFDQDHEIRINTEEYACQMI